MNNMQKKFSRVRTEQDLEDLIPLSEAEFLKCTGTTHKYDEYRREFKNYMKIKLRNSTWMKKWQDIRKIVTRI